MKRLGAVLCRAPLAMDFHDLATLDDAVLAPGAMEIDLLIQIGRMFERRSHQNDCRVRAAVAARA